MAEAARPWMAWAWLALGLALAATLLLAHPAAVVGAWLAQPALALGLSRLRGLRPVLPVPLLQRDLLALAVLWGLGGVLLLLAALYAGSLLGREEA